MLPVPAALVDGRKLPRRLQVSGGGPWFLAGPGSFERVGSGDLSLADLKAVEAELGDRVLVALPLLRSFQEHLSKKAESSQGVGLFASLGAIRRHLQHYEQVRDNAPPRVSAVARGAQVAVLPRFGPVWVDGHRLFRQGETATLPWTQPRVQLTVVRPSTVRAAMREVIARQPPRRDAEPRGG